jgi:predicted TIM-barrel fold metal-dependent hydrolase
LIIDSHTHMFHKDARDDPLGVGEAEVAFRLTYGQGKFRMPSPEEMLEEMDANGIDMAVLLPFPWLTMDACRSNNDYLLELASAHPDRFIPFAVVSPSAGRSAGEEARRCLRGGARGLGEFHAQPQRFDPLDPEAMEPLVSLAREFEVPLLIHCNEPVGHSYPGKGPVGPSEMYRFIKRFPQVEIILPHWGGGLVFYELMPEVARECQQVYYDSAASPFLYGNEIYRLASQAAGAGKILLGTDYPLIPFQRTIADARAGIADEMDVARIMGGNAANLFKIATGD